MMRSPRVRRLLVGPFVVFALSLGLTFGTSPAAEAYASPPAPITIGTVAKAAPVRMITSLTPAGLAINTAVLGGMLLYETKDSWMPVVSGLFNGDWSVGEGGATSGYTCSGSVTYVVDANKTGLTGVLAKNGCTSNTSVHKVILKDVVCYFPGPNPVGGGGGTYNVSMLTGVAGSASYSIPNLCGAGGQIVQGAIRWNLGTSTGLNNYGDWKRFNVAAPAGSTTQTASIDCRKPDGTIVTITDSLAGYGDRVAVPSCADRVPGSIPWAGSVKAGPVGGVLKDVWTFTTPQSVFDEYADCFGSSGLVCDIRVYVSGEACTRGDVACVNWKQYALDYPSRVSCKFGSHPVALTQCEPLRHAYKTATKTVTAVDPATGEPLTDPDTTTGTGTTGGAAPTTGANPTAPAVTPTETTDADTQSCFGAAWSWNPVDWVYVPIKCSFLWAFRPPSGYLDTKMSDLKTTWRGTTPGQWVDGFAGLVPGEVAGCGGIPFDPPLPGVDLGTTYIGEACSGQSATIAGMVRIGLSAAVVIGGGLACIRALGSGLGWSPGVGRGESV